MPRPSVNEVPMTGAERQARYRDMMVQLRENNVSVWRDNFMRDLQAARLSKSFHSPSTSVRKSGASICGKSPTKRP